MSFLDAYSMMKRLFSAFALSILLLFEPTAARADEILVAAAASLSDVLKEIGLEVLAKYSGPGLL